ncbi:MAG: argininosuccinate lyase [candidate division NC10 bacterium]|nr:argininosuccinate lyase [candidate division NC10 bacterium]
MSVREGKKKPWGGRFAGKTHRLVERYTASIHFDRRLYRHDIQGSIAHAKALARAGLLEKIELEKIVVGLKEIEQEIERGDFPFDPALEDIHMNIEHRLIQKVGEVGGKLHGARSRNDQIALDLRLYLREEIQAIQEPIRSFQRALVGCAEANLDIIMPGYTHLQRAQPVLLAHHLLAYFEMFERDRERLSDCQKRVNILPLGSGALAGVSLPLDRSYVARLLQFPTLSQNSIDAVSDRDFIVEFLAAVSILQMHLSRFSEELILWASAEFGFITLPDAFATGSSMMPQKKNPDVAELCRGKTGRVYGALMAMLAILKGLPLSYNRDLQEDKEPLFDAVDAVKASLEILTALFTRLTFNRERLREAAEEGLLNATDAADYLALKGMPFRKAHEVVGRLVRSCLEKGKRLEDVSLEEFRRFSPLFDKDILRFLSLEACVDRRKGIGGTARRSVVRAIRQAKKRLVS